MDLDNIVARLEALRTKYTKHAGSFAKWEKYPAAVRRYLPPEWDLANSIRLSEAEAWTLSYADGTAIPAGFLRRFREIAESAVVLFGSRKSGDAALLQWLEMLSKHASEEDLIGPVTFEDGQGNTREYGQTVRDVCALSIDLALTASQQRRKRPRKSRIGSQMDAREQIRDRIRDILRSHPGLSAREICKKLGAAERPPQAAWKDLSWPAAENDPRFRRAVRTLISRYRHQAESQ
jgi:hypothetical protein